MKKPGLPWEARPHSFTPLVELSGVADDDLGIAAGFADAFEGALEVFGGDVVDAGVETQAVQCAVKDVVARLPGGEEIERRVAVAMFGRRIAGRRCLRKKRRPR